MIEEIDQVDRQILNILQKDGRRSFAEIARKIGVNEATIRFRVKKLVDKQIIIRFSALLNPRKIGLSITGVIMAKVNPITLNETFNELKFLTELLHIFQCTGRYDFLAVANVEDMDHLEQLKIKIKSIAGIEEIEVLATTRLIKIEPSFKL